MMWKCAPLRWSSLAAIVCVCAAIGVVSADAEKRAELSPAPFVMGSRYGRSPPRLLAPRNDRFFMGSRYGKRSPPSEPLSTLVGQGPRAPPSPVPLLCDYTGVTTLFHCRPATAQDDYRRLEDSFASDED